TGCQMANFTCLAAARHAVLRDAGWNVEEQGLQGAPRVNVIIGAEAHVTIHVALRMLGLGSRNAIEVATDGEGRMKVEELQHVLSRVSGPTIVCAQAGNVNTGSFDPLPAIVAVVKERGAWLHVDAAFGLWARAAESRRALADGAELADSWATDAHKWLNVPYDCGVAIVRDAAALRASMTSKAAYLEQTSGVERDNLDWNPEFSRRARGVTVYAALRSLGRQGVADLVERCCAHARRFAGILGGDSRVKILNDVVLNQVLVRFGDSDLLTRNTIARVQQEGTCWLAGTTWHDMAAMRISVSNWATSEEDVDRSAEAILRSIDL
ncbi:MAG TPA: aminotransferase class V-fold PLP-dependent enzyme, partial [Thermoanaerobaculia bacterium]|nr:aminotransferase class V-fold PLP-dependent enzyme [Thermoanaerobaculia bacterium]